MRKMAKRCRFKSEFCSVHTQNCSLGDSLMNLNVVVTPETLQCVHGLYIHQFVLCFYFYFIFYFIFFRWFYKTHSLSIVIYTLNCITILKVPILFWRSPIIGLHASKVKEIKKNPTIFSYIAASPLFPQCLKWFVQGSSLSKVFAIWEGFSLHISTQNYAFSTLSKNIYTIINRTNRFQSHKMVQMKWVLPSLTNKCFASPALNFARFEKQLSVNEKS